MFFKKSILGLLGLTLSWCTLPAIAQADVRQTVPVERFESLRRGLNLSHWFAQAYNPTPYHLRSFIQQEDLQLIHSLGFDYVRLPLDPVFLFDEYQPTVLNPEYLGYFDNALDLILQNDLAIIVDLHPQQTFKDRLATDPQFAEQATLFWGALAAHLSPRTPERVFLEVMNEPEFTPLTPEVAIAYWQTLQTQLLTTMRHAAPEHTLIATGYNWGSIDGLLALTPVADQNVVYNFHFYEPMTFTHQGAEWLSSLALIQQLPYPATPEACAPVLATLEGRAREIAETYCNEHWNARKIEARIARAADWATQHGVRLIANEFGVYESYVRPEDRVTWLHDVRSALETYDMGWAMWDYERGFGLVNRFEDGMDIDWNIIAALRLPAAPPEPPPELPPELIQKPRHIPEPSMGMGLVIVSLLLWRLRR